LVGLWLAFGWPLVGLWLAFGWPLVGLWLAFGWPLVDFWSAFGRWLFKVTTILSLLFSCSGGVVALIKLSQMMQAKS
jgi:hypothetical protein